MAESYYDFDPGTLRNRLGDDPGTIRIVPKRNCTLGLKLPYNYRELIAYFYLDL